MSDVVVLLVGVESRHGASCYKHSPPSLATRVLLGLAVGNALGLPGEGRPAGSRVTTLALCDEVPRASNAPPFSLSPHRSSLLVSGLAERCD
jgi:hypothetical protein